MVQEILVLQLAEQAAAPLEVMQTEEEAHKLAAAVAVMEDLLAKAETVMVMAVEAAVASLEEAQVTAMKAVAVALDTSEEYQMAL